MSTTSSIFTAGAELLLNVISEAEERRLLQRIHEAPWSTEIGRRVQHYGFEYDYRGNKTHLRRLMANRPIIALLIVDDERYRLRLNGSNAESLFDQAEDNGQFLKAEPDPDDAYLWLRITPEEDLRP